MNKNNFVKLVQAVTQRDFQIATDDQDLDVNKTYYVYRKLPITGRTVGFNWHTPKTIEKMLGSFVTAFANKYKEPNPAAYDRVYGGKQYRWADKTDEQKEFAYMNHASNMYSKSALLEQVEQNMRGEHVSSALTRYGFYATEYGVGIFCLFSIEPLAASIRLMSEFLSGMSIPYKNEFSDKQWVYRFRLGMDKQKHIALLDRFARKQQECAECVPN